MAPDDTYTHGHHESVLRSHTWRTVENSAAYLVPRLRAGLAVLDVGCGPGTITADLAGRVAPGRVVGVDRSPEVVERSRAAGAVVVGTDKWAQVLGPGWYGSEAARDEALARLPLVLLAPRAGAGPASRSDVADADAAVPRDGPQIVRLEVDPAHRDVSSTRPARPT